MFSNIPLLNNLSDSDKRSLEDFVQTRSLSDGEILFNEWDPANSLYFVVEWKLEIISRGNVLWYINIGDIVWEMAIFWDDSIRSATAKSCWDTKVLVIMWFSIKEIWMSNPDLLNKLKDIINERKNKNNS